MGRASRYFTKIHMWEGVMLSTNSVFIFSKTIFIWRCSIAFSDGRKESNYSLLSSRGSNTIPLSFKKSKLITWRFLVYLLNVGKKSELLDIHLHNSAQTTFFFVQDICLNRLRTAFMSIARAHVGGLSGCLDRYLRHLWQHAWRCCQVACPLLDNQWDGRAGCHVTWVVWLSCEVYNVPFKLQKGEPKGQNRVTFLLNKNRNKYVRNLVFIII